MEKIKVQNTEVSIIKVNGEDYICLTNMLQAKDGEFFVSDWLRNRNTLEFIGIWESVHNPIFNYGEFTLIRNQAGLNRFKISVKEFAMRTNSMCIQAKAGRYGGTYAHKCQARVVEDKLPHSHECHQPKSHSAGAQQNRHPSDANPRIQQKPPDAIAAGRDRSRPYKPASTSLR